MKRDAVPARTGGELKARLEAERRQNPFLVRRDEGDVQLITELEADRPRLAVGRGEEADLVLEDDPEISRLHAELERVGGEWLVVDDGLSRNGTFVNEERVVARRRLRDGDVIKIGSELLLFRDPTNAGDAETAKAEGDLAAPNVTATQRKVLVALCRPFLEGREMAMPATNKAIAAEVYLGVDAVKAHLRALFERFDLTELPQNEKRVALSELALRGGVVSPRDLQV